MYLSQLTKGVLSELKRHLLNKENVFVNWQQTLRIPIPTYLACQKEGLW